MVTIRVPATIANMGPGFDSFGMAVALYNRFTFHPADRDALAFSSDSDVETSGLSESARDNILFRAMDKLYRHLGKDRPATHVEITADIPIARGLGSSSTAVIAGLLAANEILGKPLKTCQILQMAIEMEGHPDNVSPALLGGVVLCDNQPYQLPWPDNWRILLLSPDYPVLTEEARAILPQTVPLGDCIFNMRKTALLTYALLKQDSEALKTAMDDRIHQPYRRKLIKEYDTVEQVSMNFGAFGVIISGSGSTMAVFCPDTAQEILLAELTAETQEQCWGLSIRPVFPDFEGAKRLS